MASKEESVALDVTSTKDSFIPIFDGQPSSYREWRKRIMIYQRKMTLQKREPEAVLNLLGSLQGSAWKMLEDYPLDEAEKSGAFLEIIRKLDTAFQYDSRVELPADFSAYFTSMQRRAGQTLLQFVTEHDDRLRRLERHDVKLPSEVQGWHLLHKASLTREQKQLIMTQAPKMDRTSVQQALFTILGQDYKSAPSQPPGHDRRHPYRSSGKGRSFFADDQEEELPDEHDGAFAAEEDGEFWDEPELQDYEENFDADAAYYQEGGEDEGDDSSQFDTEAYDHAFATYLDARRRFQDLKISRGFLPVVALTEQGQGQQPSSSTSAPFSGGKGYNRGKGKGRGGGRQGKGSNVVRYPNYPPKPADPRGRAKSAMQCLRCGGEGHKAVNCTKPAKAVATSSTKRQAVESMAVLGESSMVMFEDRDGAERPDCAMIDPGASALLMGFGPFVRYVEHLAQLGFPTETILLNTCDRTFHFGGDHSSPCRWLAKLPVFIGGQFGLVQGYLLPGETPMLLGRPIAQALKIKLDLEDLRIKVGDGSWRPMLIGRHGEYLLPLSEDFSLEYDFTCPEFDLIAVESTADAENELVPYSVFQQKEGIFAAEEEADFQVGEKILSKHVLKACVTSLETRSNELHAFVTDELHPQTGPRPRILWEVYVGSSRLSTVAESLGMQVRRFGLEEGWDFSYKSHQHQFLQLLEDELPDEVFMSPTCGPWSRFQALSATTEEKKQELRELREWHHRTHLGFVRRVYEKQVSGARHAHVEQPATALSWETRALRQLPGYRATFDQCQFGALCLDPSGEWLPVRKTTSLQTTKKCVAEAMSRRCDGSHVHCQLESSMKGFGVSRTRYMENYQPSLSAVLAACMADPEPPRVWETGLAVNEAKVHTGQLVQLMTENKSEALRTVQRLHRNLGHPQPLALAELLASRSASDVVIEIAKTYQCTSCLMYHKPNQAAPASIKQEAGKFNDVLQADVLWLKIDSKKFPVLSMIDQCTKFQSAAVLHGEKTEHFIPALERNWIKHFGAPVQLLTDEGRGWLSDKMVEWTTDHCIDHQVAPGEAHTRLSLVERRHAVLRKAIEIYMSELRLSDRAGLKEALVYVLPQLNAQPTVAGFSPTQWVLGFQPQLPGVSVLDATSPAQLGSSTSFEEVLMRRNSAKTAIMQAESDQKLRRALLRRYMGTNMPLMVGQSCFYWRDARQSDLVKIRWLGPAKVVLRETDPDGKPLVYWVVHKTQLIRCAPHHVRPDFHETTKTAIDDVKSASQLLGDLKSRGVTRFLDLHSSNKRNIDDVDEDEEEISFDEDAALEEERKRRRIHDQDLADDEYSPEHSPGALPVVPPHADVEEMLEPPQTEHEEHLAIPEDLQEPETIPSTTEEPQQRQASQGEPSGEPSPMQSPKPTPEPYLDPATMSLYEKVDGESFESKRLRFQRQETLQFGPRRSSSRREERPAPYEAEPPRKAAEEDLVSHAFTVQDVCQEELPRG